MTVYINDVMVVGPGLVDKEQARSILCGQSKWVYEQMPPLKPEMLPANERRRTTPVIKLALECIQGLLRDYDDLQALSMVFASSDGDLEITDKMCAALAEDKKIVSPTLFHNSVYNAPAGYWSIASLMSGASTSLSAGDASFMCGLQEAVTQVEVDGGTVLYVAYDYPAPDMLDASRHFDYPLAIALRLGAEAEYKVLGTLALESQEKETIQSNCRNVSLEPLRKASPIGSGLPLVEALVRRARMQVVLPYLQNAKFRVSISH
ncbi:MAG TPA: hypothetical protein ENJ08_05740 [Gammaproteobacteria bacterium]|nr:hypothetical protein [Gammaproteobacteria bacterium]